METVYSSNSELVKKFTDECKERFELPLDKLSLAHYCIMRLCEELDLVKEELNLLRSVVSINFKEDI